MDNGGLPPKLVKALDYARRYGLSRDDRISLAETLLWRDVQSWKDLTDDELVRLLDALEGFALVAHLIAERSEAGELLDEVGEPEAVLPAMPDA